MPPRSAPDSAAPVRILQLTDTHLFASADGRLRGVDTRASLEAVVRSVADRAWPADIVAATGDIGHDQTAAAYERFKALVAALNVPVYCIPGNHDIRETMRRTLADPPFHYCETLEIGHWLIAGIDSCKEHEAAGHIDNDELGRLARELARTSRPHAAVFLHHPPLPMQSRWLDKVGLENAAAFLDVVATAGNVRTIVFGHVHQAFDVNFGTARVIGTPSTCAQFLPKSDRFAIDVRPPAYRHITLLSDGGVETELFWVDGDE